MESLRQLSDKDVVLGDQVADVSAQLQKWEAYVRAADKKSRGADSPR